MTDWLFALGFLVALVAVAVAALWGARLAWRKSLDGEREGWFAAMAVLLAWSGVVLAGAVDVISWLVAYRWLVW